MENDPLLQRAMLHYDRTDPGDTDPHLVHSAMLARPPAATAGTVSRGSRATSNAAEAERLAGTLRQAKRDLDATRTRLLWWRGAAIAGWLIVGLAVAGTAIRQARAEAPAGPEVVLTIIAGIADGRPAQVLERRYLVRPWTISSDATICDDVKSNAAKIVEPIRANNPQIEVVYRCTIEVTP
jgi:hypothetical protein